ncbi:MAG: DUF5407 family protein [Chlamydiota bacterium]
MTNPFSSAQAFKFKDMIDIVGSATTQAKDKLDEIKDAGSSVSIAAMFDMQLFMNRLSQFSEMSTSVMAGAHQAVVDITRNIK